jgi:hypothetical protein
MPKLWLYGDSFTLHDKADVNSWPALLAQKLCVPQYTVNAYAGASNDWIFYMLTTTISEMSIGDYVVVQTTQKHRQWFFESQPSVSNYWIKDLEKFVAPDKVKAVDMYIEHLQRDQIDDIRWTQFSLALERLTRLIDVNFLILPGFNLVNGVAGTLATVSDDEFLVSERIQPYFDSYNGIDPRSNHLSPNNHQVLADKIFNFFNVGQPIDLTSNFETKFL